MFKVLINDSYQVRSMLLSKLTWLKYCLGNNQKVILSSAILIALTTLTLHTSAQQSIKSADADSLTQVPAELKKLYDNLMHERANVRQKADEPEIDGLIFDETRSKAGHEFYEYFFNNWEPPRGASNFSIYISEMPFLMNLSIISVKLNDYEVINTRLQPRGDFITSLAADAVTMTKEALLNLEDLRRQVEQGDQIGTGIY